MIAEEFNGLPAEVTKYLRKYSAGNWKLVKGANILFDMIIVIPAIAEYENVHRLLLSLSGANSTYFEKTLILFVVNNLPSSVQEVKVDNRKLIDLLRLCVSGASSGNLVAEKVRAAGINIALIDASTEGNELPEKEGGVGLARKIGMDLALTQFDYKSPCKKIIVCLDADCIVSPNYITTIYEHVNARRLSAGYVEYEHQRPKKEEELKAITCYEIFLRYYAAGLKFADSPYSFPTIGSTIFCDFESYIKIGGMNKRKAAEDFYFLEKLAKITKVEKIEEARVYPSGRISWRVPFGTGQRVGRFLNGSHNEYLLFDPAVFSILKKWNSEFYENHSMNAEQYIELAGSINPRLKEFFEMNSFRHNFEKMLSNSKSDLQLVRQKKYWFDGFRTLKLIHYLRDTDFPLYDMFEALDRFFEMAGSPAGIMRKERIPSIEIQLKYLKHLKSLR